MCVDTTVQKSLNQKNNFELTFTGSQIAEHRNYGPYVFTQYNYPTYVYNVLQFKIIIKTFIITPSEH